MADSNFKMNCIRMTHLGHFSAHCNDLIALTMCTKLFEIKFRKICDIYQFDDGKW